MTRIARHLVTDLMRALAVLGLVFLSFAHAPLTPSSALAGEVAGVATSDFCLSHGALPVHKSPAKCEACRIASGIDLPPAPPAADPPVCGVLRAALPVAATGLSGPALLAHGPRGPPALA